MFRYIFFPSLEILFLSPKNNKNNNRIIKAENEVKFGPEN